MTTTESTIAHLLLKEEVSEFLYAEAELLDDRHFEEWLDLLTDDIRYWMPMRRNVKSNEMDREFTREGQDINWFDEGKETLDRRVRQILTGVQPYVAYGSLRGGQSRHHLFGKGLTREQAESLCSSLQQRNEYCAVVEF